MSDIEALREVYRGEAEALVADRFAATEPEIDERVYRAIDKVVLPALDDAKEVLGHPPEGQCRAGLCPDCDVMRGIDKAIAALEEAVK